MSDGNFNKNLLPYNNYQSGVRAGKSAMRQAAVQAFARFVDTRFPEASDGERRQMTDDFKRSLP